MAEDADEESEVESNGVPDIVYEKPNVFDEEAFREWREKCPEKYLWDDYEHVEKMRLLRDQLVEETNLSEREAEVAILRAEGYDYEDVASQLSISPSTAAEYGYRAREKVLEAVRTIRALKKVDEEWLLEVISDKNQ